MTLVEQIQFEIFAWMNYEWIWKSGHRCDRNNLSWTRMRTIVSWGISMMILENITYIWKSHHSECHKCWHIKKEKECSSSIKNSTSPHMLDNVQKLIHGGCERLTRNSLKALHFSGFAFVAFSAFFATILSLQCTVCALIQLNCITICTVKAGKQIWTWQQHCLPP